MNPFNLALEVREKAKESNHERDLLLGRFSIAGIENGGGHMAMDMGSL